MVRATSLASFNLQKSDRIQSLVKDDIDRESICFGGIHRYTLRLPANVACVDIWVVMPDLLDRTTQQHLERRGVLNWHPHFGKLVAMKMSGNRNCLLHAISTYMWGIQDSNQTLWKLLCRALTEPTTSRPLRKRFMEHLRAMGNARCQSSQEDMQRKWDAVVSIASSAPSQQADNDLLLRAIEIYMYIFTMAQILRRPIILLAEDAPLSDGGPSLGGIYLPLQRPAEECVKNPIILAYHSGQFFPLLSTLAPQQATSPVPIDAVPMIRQNGESLPVHLLLPEEAGHVQEYINQRIDTIQVQDHYGNCPVAARLGSLTPPTEFNLLLDIFLQTGGGPNSGEARESSPGPAALENRNREADQITSVSCTQGAEGLTSGGADLDQQMLRMSIQKEVVSHSCVSQVPWTERAMTLTASPYTIADNQHNLDVAHMAAPSQQNTKVSPSSNQGEVNYNNMTTSSERGGWEQNSVASATADGNHASGGIGRSPNTNDNREQWEATGAKPKQYSSRSKDGSRTMGNPPPCDESICKTAECDGIAVPCIDGICVDCYCNTKKERVKRNKKRCSIQNPSAGGQANQQREARKTRRSADQDREQQTQSGQRPISSAPTTSKNSSSAKAIKEQKSMQQANTSTSTANTSGRSSATDNVTLMKPLSVVLGLQTTPMPEVPQSNDAGSRPETTFLPNSGPPSSIIYASSSGQSSATSTHVTEPSVIQMLLNGTSDYHVNQLTNNESTSSMQHNADEPLVTSSYHTRTIAQHSADGAVPENHNYMPADHLVKCLAPSCDRQVNKDMNGSLCEVCHQVLGQINQMSLSNSGTLILGQGSSSATTTRPAARDAAATLMTSDASSPKTPAKHPGKGSAVNPPMRIQQAVHMPSELRSAHQYPRSLLQQQGTGHHQTVPPPDLSTEQPATQPCVIRGCRYTGTRKNTYLCSLHFQEIVVGASSSTSFDASGNISLHTDPEPRSSSASVPFSISCNSYNVFERGSIQNYINNPSPADNSTPKLPGSARASVPFPDPADACRSARTRARGSPSPQNGQTPLSSPSPPLPPRQGPFTHMMYGQFPRNGPPQPLSYGFPSGQGSRQAPRTQWNNLSACSNETKPFTQHPMQDPALHSNSVGPRNTLSSFVPISTMPCNNYMRGCNQKGDPAYSGFCPQCFDFIQRNRKC